MTRYDLYWCLGGLIPGLIIAYGTMHRAGFSYSSFEMGQLTGNVVGPVLLAFVIGRVVRRLSKRG